MLEIFHKHQKSIPVIVLALLACVSMLPFGTGMGGSGSRDAYAIKVNGEEISQNTFNLVRSNLENIYRQRFGDYYNQLISSANINISQQAIDRLIESELLRQFNQRQGIAPSEAAVQQQIQRFFGGEYSQQQLATFLKNTGQTPQQLRSRLELDLQTTLTNDILSDFSKLSEQEITNQVKQEETAYNYQLAKFIPANFVEKAEKPSQQELKAFYDDRVADYETPEKTQYDYLYFDPTKNLDLVEVDQDQIELYYSENQSRFIIPERVKVREIIVKEEADASQLVGQINSGADFEELAKENSTTPALAKASWKNRGEDSPGFDDLAFSGQVGNTEIIESEDSTRIIRIEDYQEERMQELTAVQNEIKKALQEQDIAAFLLIKVEDLLAAAQEKNQKLADLAKAEGMMVVSTALTDATIDPTPQAKGLTERVIANHQQTLQLQEIQDDIYLVEIKDYQAPRYPELKEIRKQLVAAWKNEQADELVATKAQQFLSRLDQVKQKNLTADKFIDLANKAGAEVVKEEDLKLAAASSKPELSSPEAQEAFSVNKKGLIKEVFGANGSEKYVFYLEEVKPPTEEEIQQVKEDKATQYNQQSSTKLYQALVDSLKAQAEIEIAGNLRNSI